MLESLAMKLHELPTPVPLIDLDIMARNIARAVETCRRAGVNYRPHIKTHKIPALAQRQVKAGAVGITCAKIGEAEVMAKTGLDDIFLAYLIVGHRRFERLAALAEKVRLIVAVDHLDAARALAEFFHARGRQLNALLEIETGAHRCGVLPGEEAENLAALLARLPGLCFRGVFTYEGHVYAGRSPEEIADRARRAGQTIVEVVNRLRARGLPVEVVSVGSSPARDAACRVPGVTENRPGTNIFNDCTQVNLGVCSWEDCALNFLCTVVSRPAPDRAIVDGGTKTFGSVGVSELGGYGRVLGYAGARFTCAWEEHGMLSLEDEAARRLRIGDRVRIIPNRAGTSMNLHERAFGIRGDEVIEEWQIAARGCVD